MPPELEAALPWVLGALAAGLFLSWLVTWLALSGRRTRLEERLKAGERQLADLAARHAAATSEATQHEANSQALRTQLAEIRTRLEGETRGAAEKQALLDRSEQRRVALEALLKPVAESIGKLDSRLAETEKSHGEGIAALDARMQALAAQLDVLAEGLPSPALPVKLPEFGDDFGFVPDPQQKAFSAASDLRSALEG
ncbi:hypothetical protein [Luteolibacter sp. Populi]|uniref:hypothetical protein n=1 Tax=Luteolibacter sp. Populi TaxID=3230487 RepID=UPI003465F0D1